LTRSLLADENFPSPVVEGIAAAGHDVLSVARFAPGLNDRGVLALAREQQRGLLTFDADFGELVFLHGLAPPPAILYFRLWPIVLADVLQAALRALAQVPEGSLAVVTRDGVRWRSFAAVPRSTA